jgi:hypothetical protein
MSIRDVPLADAPILGRLAQSATRAPGAARTNRTGWSLHT